MEPLRLLLDVPEGKTAEQVYNDAPTCGPWDAHPFMERRALIDQLNLLRRLRNAGWLRDRPEPLARTQSMEGNTP